MARRMDRFSHAEDGEDINLTPMLDVVFIMLIFFIVTATFIKQPGVDVLRPEAETADKKPTVSVLIAIGANGDIWIDKKQYDPDAVRAIVEKLHAENPKGSTVVQADKDARTEQLMAVLEAVQAAGIRDVAIATET